MTKATAPKFHHSSIIKTTNGHWFVKVTCLADKSFGVKNGPFSTSAECSALIPSMVAELRELVAKGAKTPVAAAVAPKLIPGTTRLSHGAAQDAIDMKVAAQAQSALEAIAAKNAAAQAARALDRTSAPDLLMALVDYSVTGAARTSGGMEGPGLKATLNRAGRKVATYVDYGDGAMTGHWDWVDARGEQVDVTTRDYNGQPHVHRGSKEEAFFESFIYNLPMIPANPKNGLPEMHNSAEVWLEDRANDLIELARVARLRKTNVFFHNTKKGCAVTIKRPATPTLTLAMIQRVIAKDTTLVCLEGAADADILALMKA